MIKTEILQKDNPILREQAQLVSVKDIGSKKIKDVLARMKKAMHSEEDGAAIAAPQIGVGLRIFMVNGNVIGANKDPIFINPEIIKASQKKKKVEEGCLSVRWLYGKVNRSEKVTIRAYDEKGKKIERGASGLLAQIFQHEVDHLNGVLFIDKAEELKNIPPANSIRTVFFGSSDFSKFVLEELKDMGYSPILSITSAKEPLPMKKLKEAKADVFIVASFGKILSKEVLDMPKNGILNVHPSLLPELRGPSPIQDTILGHSQPGVSIMKLDEKMDHGPILAQARLTLTPWPDKYEAVEEKLARVGGRILGTILPDWIEGRIPEKTQDNSRATYSKIIKKEDGLLDLSRPAEENLRKVLAYHAWPGAYMFYKNKFGREIRLTIKDAEMIDGKFIPKRVVPAGKKEMDWQDFLRGN